MESSVAKAWQKLSIHLKIKSIIKQYVYDDIHKNCIMNVKKTNKGGKLTSSEIKLFQMSHPDPGEGEKSVKTKS